jgi:hypothetical protein
VPAAADAITAADGFAVAGPAPEDQSAGTDAQAPAAEAAAVVAEAGTTEA